MMELVDKLLLAVILALILVQLSYSETEANFESLKDVKSISSEHDDTNEAIRMKRSRIAQQQNIQWNNQFDRPVSVECDLNNGEALFRVRSKFASWARDRRWKWNCHKVADKPMSDCSWTPHINTWGGPIDKKCSDNFVLTGIKSEHWNAKEDRRWRLKCCKVPGYETSDCKKTRKLNKYAGFLDHKVSKKGGVFMGLHSLHHINHWDRAWQLYECQYKAKEAPTQPAPPPQQIGGITHNFFFVPYDMLSDFNYYMPWSYDY